MYEQKNETPVLMLTAAGTENIAVEAMKFGAYDYIRKEQLQFEVLPILINGVYQQFLFRKEKENKEFIQINKQFIRVYLSLAVNSTDELLENQQDTQIKRYIKITEPEIYSKS